MEPDPNLNQNDQLMNISLDTLFRWGCTGSSPNVYLALRSILRGTDLVNALRFQLTDHGIQEKPWYPEVFDSSPEAVSDSAERGFQMEKAALEADILVVLPEPDNSTGMGYDTGLRLAHQLPTLICLAPKSFGTIRNVADTHEKRGDYCRVLRYQTDKELLQRVSDEVKALWQAGKQ